MSTQSSNTNYTRVNSSFDDTFSSIATIGSKIGNKPLVRVALKSAIVIAAILFAIWLLAIPATLIDILIIA